jgi:hypothetical protein
MATLAIASAQVPAGTRVLVEMRDKLEAKKVKPGKKFEARTLEALKSSDGRVVDSGTKLRGRVASADSGRLLLRFEEIQTSRGWKPIVATVKAVVGERDIRDEASTEGEIRSESSRGKGAAIGAAVLGGVGAAIGASQAGGRGALIGAGAGAGTGAAVGAAAGGSKDLVLDKGTRIELQVDRPLAW